MAAFRYCIILLCFVWLSPTGHSQVTNADVPAKTDTGYHARLVVNKIFVSGNKKTRLSTILRELPFKSGDTVTIAELVAVFRRTRELLFNTRLFTGVIVSAKNMSGYSVDVQIDLRERWYIFPVPYFRPIDRNLSAWGEHHYSLARVNYGLKFLHSNFTGRNDRLRIWLLTGYTKQVQFNYDQPASDKSLKHGFGFGMQYAALKEINISTTGNEQFFVNRDTLAGAGKYLLKQASATVNYFYRPALTTRHVVRLTLNAVHADSLVAVINPHYFSNGAGKFFYPELSYSLEYQKVDYVAYVLRGFMGDVNFTRKGVTSDMNLSQFTGRFTYGLPLGNNWFAGWQGYSSLKLPLDQPYFNQRMLGYGDTYLRGLERYVVDGVAGMLLRNTLRKHIYSFSVNGLRLPTLPSVPFAIYAKVYGDMGYVYNRNVKTNSLVNQMLYTAGAGIDIVSAYDFVFRCEYSFNQLGQPGLFFHIRNDF